MFPEGSPDMNALLQQAAAMQQQLMAAQEDLANREVEGSSGGGLVRATGTCSPVRPSFFRLAVPRHYLRPRTFGSSSARSSLTSAACDCISPQQQAAAQMGQLTGGFGEGLSGLGLGGPGGSDEDDDRPQGPAGFVH